MARTYELRAGEGPFEALTRIVVQLMKTTAADLRNTRTGMATRVHESRKRFKEVRALLRMSRGALGEDAFTIENHWYRDAAREIAEYRDVDAAVAAVASLAPKVKKELGPVAMRGIRRVTAQEHHAIYHAGNSAEARMAKIAAQLPVAAARLSLVVPATSDGFASLERGIRRTLRDGRRAMHAAYRSGDPASFHEWRKRVKDHWYHVQLLEPVWPSLTRRNARLDTLSHLLGEHHDIEVIRGIVATAESAFTIEEAARIDAVLAARQRQLERKAESIGRNIYAKRPKDFTQKLRKRRVGRANTR